MNYFTATVIIGWQTRNDKRHQKALVWCKDYGLKPILLNLSIGNLYEKEERSLTAKFQREFGKKTDKFFSVRICQSCYETVGFNPQVKERLEDLPEFELVQVPINLTKKSKKARKPKK